MGAMRFSFDGTIVSMDGPRITYRVDRVRQDNPFGAGQIPEPGGTVVVRYDGSPGELMPRESYRVKGWNNQSGGDGVSSQIAYDFHGDCGTGAGTTAIDGSYLGSSSTGFDRSWPYAAAGLVVALSVVLALLAAVARRYDRKLG